MGEPFRARPRQVWAILKHTGKEFFEDRAIKQAAALAYYALFAMGPLLLLVISIAGLFVDPASVRQALSSEMGKLLGPEGQRVILQLMEGSDRDRGGLWGLALGGGALLIGALGVFHQLKDSMNRVWEVRTKRPDSIKGKLRVVFRDRLLGAAGVLGAGFLLLVSLAVFAGIGAASSRAQQLLPFDAWVTQGLHLLATLLVAALVFALLFRYLPDVEIRWRDVLFGALVTAILFVLGELLIGLYIGQTATASRYGAAGAVMVVILWVYYSGIILFFGAELTQVYANRHGGHIRVDEEHAVSRIEAVTTRQRHPSREGTASAPGDTQGPAGSQKSS